MPKRQTRRATRRLRRRLRGGALVVTLGQGKTMAFPGDLDVTLNDGAPAKGQIVTVEAATPKPQVSWTPTASTFYTLMCFDPDAPASTWLHWLVTNIEGGTPASGQTLMSWAPPTPPPSTGIHHYYFCLFSHEARVIARAPKERGYFKPADFIAPAGMKPVSVAFYRVRAA